MLMPAGRWSLGVGRQVQHTGHATEAWRKSLGLTRQSRTEREDSPVSGFQGHSAREDFKALLFKILAC